MFGGEAFGAALRRLPEGGDSDKTGEISNVVAAEVEERMLANEGFHVLNVPMAKEWPATEARKETRDSLLLSNSRVHESM